MKKFDFNSLSKYLLWQDISNTSSSTQPKFSRRFIKPARIWLYGLIAKITASNISSDNSCDVLILHRSKKSQKLGLRDTLVKELRNRGLHVIETHIEKNKTILKKCLFSLPEIEIPIKFQFYACYAKLIIQQYNPKTIITDSNGSVLAPFIKILLPEGCNLIHIAHSMTTDNLRHFSLVEFDYYFLYGRSSLDRLRKRDVLFGKSKAVLTGPYLANSDFSLPIIQANKNILLFGVGPNLEKHTRITDMYSVINSWIVSHPDYQLTIKLHPRSSLEYWHRQEQKTKNIQVLSKNTPMTHALQDVSITLSIYTNAVLDAALLNRPSLLVANKETSDELDIEKFFLPRSETADELNERMEEMLENYPYHVQQSKAFITYHLEHQQDSVTFISSCIDSIVHGKEEFPVEELQGQTFLIH
jgi:hypothetical protein